MGKTVGTIAGAQLGMAGGLPGAIVGGKVGGNVGQSMDRDNSEAGNLEAARALQRERLQAEEEARNRALDRFKREREENLRTGRARGQELFGTGSLGRVNEVRSADITDIINRRKAGLEGFNAAENQGLREQAFSGLNSNAATQARALRSAQGGQGLSGATAAAQMARLGQAQDDQKRGLERDLMIANIQQKQQALDSYQQAVSGTEADELARQKYNLGAGAAEKAGQISTEFGYGNLGAAEQSAAQQSAIGQAMQMAAIQKQPTGKK